MTVNEVKKLLSENGWRESSNFPNGWYCGLASIIFGSDSDGRDIIKLLDDDWGYVEAIARISFSNREIQIFWKGFEEWKLVY